MRVCAVHALRFDFRKAKTASDSIASISKSWLLGLSSERRRANSFVGVLSCRVHSRFFANLPRLLLSKWRLNHPLPGLK
jgi:hypothetical protein